jgi:hypothetical protein
MTAIIIPFPTRGPFAVCIEREDEAWLVIAKDHGWLFGSHHEATKEAREIARGFGVAVVEKR